MKNDPKCYPNFKDLKHKQKVKERKKIIYTYEYNYNYLSGLYFYKYFISAISTEVCQISLSFMI